MYRPGDASMGRKGPAAHPPLPTGPLVLAVPHPHSPQSVSEDPRLGKTLLDDQGGGQLYDKRPWYTPPWARSLSQVLVAGIPGSAVMRTQRKALAARNV